VLAALLPFLIFGAWENTAGDRLSRIQSNFQSLSGRITPGPSPGTR
jgi:hypothetical protein